MNGGTRQRLDRRSRRLAFAALAAAGLGAPPAFADSAIAQAQESAAAAAPSDSDLARKIQNPIGDLYSFPFQSNTNFGYGPHGGTQDVLNVQPVIPIHLDADWNLITRAILPLVWTPDMSPAKSVPFGSGPTTVSAFLSPSQPKDGWLWGIGPVVQIPTISDASLGSSVWGGGPTAVVVFMTGPIVTGALANAVWSFGGTRVKGAGGPSYSTFLLRPFFNFNFSDGWYVGTSPLVTADWQAAGTKWTVPVGAQIGRVIRVGKLPVNLLLGAYCNVVKPEYGANWQLRSQVTLIS